MKQFINKEFILTLCLALGSFIFCSCEDNIEDIHTQLDGHWIISEVAMAHPMTIDFFEDKLGTYAETLNTDAPNTPDFGCGDYQYKYVAFLNDEGDTVLRFSYEHEDYDGDYSSSSSCFIYHRIDNTSMMLISEKHPFSPSKTYKFIRR